MPPPIFRIRGCPIRAGVRTGSVGTLPISVSSSGQGWAGVAVIRRWEKVWVHCGLCELG